ncbi:MAG: hypothetical protein DWQ05_09165 [Calditrichaeota bacterium]|nr:MAG: hypothetical protein DWQ05_09165 [Calditrichota bacterium]
MNSKDKIINKLRGFDSASPELIPSPKDNEVFADYPETDPQNLIAVFEKQFASLKGEFYQVNSLQQAGNTLLAILKSAEGEKYCADFSPIFSDMCAAVPDLVARFENPALTHKKSTDFAEYAAGVSSADFLVARTGSLILRSAAAGGRRLSVLPPLHIVIATHEHLVSSLDDVFSAENFTSGDWSYGTIISGPSRTSDIEKILVLGAHGPKRLAVILITD